MNKYNLEKELFSMAIIEFLGPIARENINIEIHYLYELKEPKLLVAKKV